MIGKVARMIAYRFAAGVRGNDRSIRNLKDGIYRLVGGVGNVNQHAKAVHFTNHLTAKVVETTPAPLILRRVGPLVGVGMGERHADDPHIAKRSKYVQIALDDVPSFDR